MSRIKDHLPAAPLRGLALIACYDLVDDPATGRRDVIGIFGVITSASFPAAIEKFYVWCAVAGSGTQDAFVDLTDERGNVIAEGGFRVSNWGIRGVCEAGIALRDVTFARPGVYRLRLFTAQGVLLERNLVAREGKLGA